MDELEFRRRAIAHPHEQDPAFLDQAQRSPANRKHLDEMKQLDRSLQRAMEVEVLAGLAERILLRQALEADQEQVVPLPVRPRSNWRALAMAASVAFLLGMSTRWLSWPLAAPDEPLAGPGRHGPRLWRGALHQGCGRAGEPAHHQRQDGEIWRHLDGHAGAEDHLCQPLLLLSGAGAAHGIAGAR